MLTRENLAADSVVDRQNKSGVLAEYTLFIPQAVLPISVEVGAGVMDTERIFTKTRPDYPQHSVISAARILCMQSCVVTPTSRVGEQEETEKE